MDQKREQSPEETDKVTNGYKETNQEYWSHDKDIVCKYCGYGKDDKIFFVRNHDSRRFTTYKCENCGSYFDVYR